jgi:Rrf2 family protein
MKRRSINDVFNLRTHYALKLLVYLALQYNDDYHTIDDLAEQTGIPRSFLGKIVQKLASAQFLETRKGPRGGVKLNHPPEAIRIVDVLEELGELHPGLDPEDACHAMETFDNCVMELFVDGFISSVLEDRTLAELSEQLVESPS